MNLLFVSFPIGPIGFGIGGGVELTMRNASQALAARGHRITVLAPEGSRLDWASLITVPGAFQVPAQHQERDAPIVMPAGPVVAALWEQARRLQCDFDAIVNFAYDWLPVYLSPFFATPVAHLISMASLSDAMDTAIAPVLDARPSSIAMHTRAQAATFASADRCRIIGNGLDLSLYPFNAAPDDRLCWVGRIVPEKGLEDAAAVAQATRLPLDVLGVVEDADYWEEIRRRFAGAPIHYRGFLDTGALAHILRRSRALLMTPKWVEAFGNVAMEALACGVPVLAYARGGPAELIDDGRTGYLVEPDSVQGLIEAVGRAGTLDRHACRAQAEREFSLPALGTRFEAWLADLVSSSSGDPAAQSALACA